MRRYGPKSDQPWSQPFAVKTHRADVTVFGGSAVEYPGAGEIAAVAGQAAEDGYGFAQSTGKNL